MSTKGQSFGVWGFGVEAVVGTDRLHISYGSTVSMLVVGWFGVLW